MDVNFKVRILSGVFSVNTIVTVFGVKLKKMCIRDRVQCEQMVLRPESGIIGNKKCRHSFEYRLPVVAAAVITEIFNQFIVDFFCLAGLFYYPVIADSICKMCIRDRN